MFVSLIGIATAAAAMPATQARTQPATLAEACRGRDGWSDPAPPARVFANVYYVGTCGISVILVTGPAGHVLIDGATAEAAPTILRNIRALGFQPGDIRFIVGSHEHVDHMGGFSRLKAATGARLLVRGAARKAVETGRTDPADPQVDVIPDMPPVTVDGVIRDGRAIRVGTLALTPVATPGHTAGGTSWTWRSCQGARCLNFAYVDSLTAGSGDGYRFSEHPERVAPFRTTFGRVAALKCDVLITPHPSVSALFERLSGKAPLIDADACARLARSARDRLEARLSGERAR